MNSYEWLLIISRDSIDKGTGCIPASILIDLLFTNVSRNALSDTIDFLNNRYVNQS